MKNQIWQVSDADSSQRPDKWLPAAPRLGSRSEALAAIERGKVFVKLYYIFADIAVELS